MRIIQTGNFDRNIFTMQDQEFVSDGISFADRRHISNKHESETILDADEKYVNIDSIKLGDEDHQTNMRFVKNEPPDIEVSDYIVLEKKIENFECGVKKTYLCSKCNFTTRKRRKFKAHWIVHDHEKFQCDICKKEFQKISTLKRHQLIHTERKYFLCDLCGRSYLHSISLKYHKMGHLKHNPIAGERTKLIQQKNNNGDRKVEEKPKNILCDLCGKVFKQASSLKSHRQKHEKELNSVTNHQNEFEFEEYMNKKRPGPKRKYPLIAEKKKFKCSECPYAAVRCRDVEVHLRTHTGEKPFPCNICGKFFSKESAVERHKLIHRVEKGQNTDDKTINAKPNSKESHVTRTRTDYNGKIIKPIDFSSGKNCLDIGNKMNGLIQTPNPMNLFNSSAYSDDILNLQKSAAIRNSKVQDYSLLAVKSEELLKNEMKFKYPYFDDSATARSIHESICKNLNISSANRNDSVLGNSNESQKCDANVSEIIDEHNRQKNLYYANNVGDDTTHLDGQRNSVVESDVVKLKPHVIRIDGKEMRKPKEKKVLQPKEGKCKKIKGERKKHKCDQCPYETFLSRDMRVHLRKHSGERPFPCPICGKRFTKESVVKRHQTVHTGLRPHQCEYCFKTFSQQSNLKMHKIAHFDVVTGLLKTDIHKVKDVKENDTDVTETVDLIVDTKKKTDDIKMNSEKAVTISDDTRSKINVKQSGNNRELRKGRNIKKNLENIEVVNVDKIENTNEILKFEIKTEDCSSDDECLSKLKETILQKLDSNINSDQDPKFHSIDIKEEVDNWQNNEGLDQEGEFKENNVKCENIMKIEQEIKTEQINEEDINSFEEYNNLSAKVERKKRKKMKKIKKLKKEKEVINNCELYEDNFIPRQINEGNKILFKCEECHYAVVNKRDLIVHMRSHSGEKLFSCDICQKKFSKQSVVKRHKLIHFGIRPFTCHLCGLTFTQCNSLKKHIEIKHGIEEKDLPYKCDVCSATFAQEKSLKTHKHAHLRKKNNEFSCHICGKMFRHECRLKAHLLLHDDRQFSCSICSKKFLRKYDLKYHSLIHTQEKQCVCHVCGGLFSTPSTLKMHLRSHSPPTKFSCDICSESFSKSSNLLNHRMMAHNTDENSFNCSMCDKSFSQASSLKKHHLTHSFLRLHQCSVCSKRFKLIGHLYKHYNSTKHGSINEVNVTNASNDEQNLPNTLL